MNGRQYIARVRTWAKARNLQVRFGIGRAGIARDSICGERKTTVEGPKRDIGKGLFAKMLDDLGIEKNDFYAAVVLGYWTDV